MSDDHLRHLDAIVQNRNANPNCHPKPNPSPNLSLNPDHNPNANGGDDHLTSVIPVENL